MLVGAKDSRADIHMQNYQLGILVKFRPLHVFEKILCALHEDNPFERRVFAHDSAAAVRSYDELTQSNIILELDKLTLAD